YSRGGNDVMEDRVARLESKYMEQYQSHMKRQERRKKRLRRRLTLFAIVLLTFIGLLTSYHLKQRTTHAEKIQEYESLQSDFQVLEKEEAQLNEEIKLLNNDDYVLEIARTNYFFSKKGELLFK